MDHKPVKILIVHASAGLGHEKAARALAAAAASLVPAARLEVLDALDFFPRWFKRLYAGSYLFMIHRAPFLWGLVYGISNVRGFAFPVRVLRRLVNGVLGARLGRRIAADDPDIVFSTHFLPAEVAAHLKKKKRIRSACVTMITDFLVHGFWVVQGTDRYLGALPQTRDALGVFGVPQSCVRVTGIPIDAKFSRAGDRAARCAALGLDPALFTVLVTSGGSGTGPMTDIVSRIVRDPGAQAIVVCGRNARLERAVARFAAKNTRVRAFGFVTNMDELMDAADAVVGKAGGLTLSEALAKRKPFFILSPVPGQEMGNTKVAVAAGAGVWIRKPADLSEWIERLRTDAAARAKMIAAVDALRRPYSAVDAARAGFEIAGIHAGV